MHSVSFRRHLFSPLGIKHDIWRDMRFSLDELNDVLQSHEIVEVHIGSSLTALGQTIATWYADYLTEARPDLVGDWFIDEVFVSRGRNHAFLWRAVDQNGGILATVAQSKRDEMNAVKYLGRKIVEFQRQPITLPTNEETQLTRH